MAVAVVLSLGGMFLSYLCTYDLYGPVRNVFDLLRGQVGVGWALEVKSFWTCETASADRGVSFGGP